MVSATFFKVGGKKLQDDFKKLVKPTSGLKPKNVVASNACAKLCCQSLLHLGVERWTSANGNQV